MRTVHRRTFSISKIVVQEPERSSSQSHWKYVCTSRKLCQRVLSSSKLKGLSLQTCHMTCEKPNLWPFPKEMYYTGRLVSYVKIEAFSLRHNTKNTSIEKLLKKAYIFFYKNIFRMIRGNSVDHPTNLKSLTIKLSITDVNGVQLKLKTSESYTLESRKNNGKLLVQITSETFYGARHGLETLSQLIWWDEIEKTLMVLHNIQISDGPVFPYRGLMIDTARNYFSINSIKRNLRGMAACKLNVLHWHLTDSQSFPFIPPQYPKLGRYGAYSKNKVYTAETIRDVIEYARPLGIRIIIEIDAPAHMLEGWRQLNKDFIIPSPQNGSGQLNPDNEEVFQILALLYEDILKLTEDNELFHIGADEVDMDLWLNTSTFEDMSTTTQRNVYYVDLYETATDLWMQILSKIFNILNANSTMQRSQYAILWSSDVMMSSSFSEHLHQSNTIIQHWLGSFISIKRYRYKVIFSDVTPWYLDCGFGQWMSKIKLTEPPCPYNSWDKFYTHSPWNHIDFDRMLGGEVCLWSENVGEKSLDARIWPRTAAFAETVWNAPVLPVDSIRLDVFIRLDVQTQRLRSRGIKTQTLWPQWCTQHPGECT